MIEFTKLVYHENMISKLRPVISSGKLSTLRYNGGPKGFICTKFCFDPKELDHKLDDSVDDPTSLVVKIHPKASDPMSSNPKQNFSVESWTLLGAERADMRRVIERKPSLSPEFEFKSIQTIIDAESTVSDDIQKIIQVLLASFSSAGTDPIVMLKGVKSPYYWLDLPAEWILRGGKPSENAENEHLMKYCTNCNDPNENGISHAWFKLIQGIDSDSHRATPSEKCVQHWLKEIKSSMMEGVMFLHFRMEYFNLRVVPDLLGGYWNGKAIVDPRKFWNCSCECPFKSIHSMNQKITSEKSLLLIRYKASNDWHTNYDEPEFWDKETSLIWDESDPGGTWSKFVNSVDDKTCPDGMIDLDTIICHRHLRYKLRNILNSYRGDVIFTDRDEAFVHMYIPYASCEPDSGTAENFTKQIQRIIDTIREEGKGIEEKLFYAVVGDSRTENVTDLIHEAVNHYKYLTGVSYENISELELDSDGSQYESEPHRSQSESDDSQEESAD